MIYGNSMKLLLSESRNESGGDDSERRTIGIIQLMS